MKIRIIRISLLLYKLNNLSSTIKVIYPGWIYLFILTIRKIAKNVFQKLSKKSVLQADFDFGPCMVPFWAKNEVSVISKPISGLATQNNGELAVMLVTLLSWRFYSDGSFQMLVIFVMLTFLCKNSNVKVPDIIPLVISFKPHLKWVISFTYVSYESIIQREFWFISDGFLI